MRVRLASIGVLLLLACGDVSRADPRFATPERTVQTLLASHGVADEGGDEVAERMIAAGGLTLVDRAAYQSCFADLDAPGGPAMAAYVLGLLAAAHEELRYQTVEHHGYVLARDERIVMRRGDDGAYRIVLTESVPDDVRRSLVELRGAVPGPGSLDP